MPSYSESESSSSGARARALNAGFPVRLNPEKESGILKYCYCGAPAIIETSNSQLNPGRRFYTCPNVDDGECHIWKWWDVAVTEELELIDRNYGSIAKKMDAATLKCEFYEAQDEIAQLKDARVKNELKIVELEMLIAGMKKKKGGFEIHNWVASTIVLAAVFFIVFFNQIIRI